MTTAEREALLKLWEDVPECRPNPPLLFRLDDQNHPTIEASPWFQDNDDDEDEGQLYEAHAAAIARDAMVEYLHEQCWQHNSAKQPNHHDPKQRYILWHGGSAGHTGETRLLALVSACRKVAGK